jgi:outer membrane protein TolC
LTGAPVAADSLVDPASVAETASDAPASIEASAAIAAARSALEAAEQGVRAIGGERWGNLILNADAGAIGVRPDDTFSRNGGAQFLVGYTIPLFDGARSGRLSAALAEVSIARARLEEARRSATLALERLEAEEARARADALAARSSLPVAERNFELLRARHLGGGSVRLLDVLDGLTQISDLRRAIARAEKAARLAAAGRMQALGEVGS